MNLTQKEVQERLCVLTSRVMREVFDASIPADCHCDQKLDERAILDKMGMTFQFDEAVLDFIEAAVMASIELRAARKAKREVQS